MMVRVHVTQTRAIEKTLFLQNKAFQSCCAIILFRLWRQKSVGIANI